MRAFVFVVLALAACSHAPPPPPAPQPAPTPAPQIRTELGRQVQADMARLDAELRASNIVSGEIGQLADLGGGLNVRPLAIIEDSRCPANVQCLWEGRMRILATVSGRNTELTLGQSHETPNGVIVFVLASPGAWAEWPSDELGPRPASRLGFRRG